MKLRQRIGIILAFLILWIPMTGSAEIAGPEAFDDLTWELVFEDSLHGGVVQSVCVTEDYIITIENIADDAGTKDIVSAYYRNTTDGAGNPVEPYTLAKRVEEREWEHGNGMTYNSKTNEIYVSLYTNMVRENRGCLYVMDPETLSYKRTIKVTDNYNILSIDYMEASDQYVIQTDAAGGFFFKILNSEFELVEDLGSYEETMIGYNFQDCVAADGFILTFPLTMDLRIGDFLCVYSIEERRLISSVPMSLDFEYAGRDEPESICRLSPDEFLIVVDMHDENSVRFYKTKVPYICHVSVSSEFGRVSSEKISVLKGENYSFEFTPDDGYRLKSIIVDGAEQELAEDMTGFSMSNVQTDQNVHVTFEKIPFPIWKAVFLTIALLAFIVIVFFIFRRVQRYLEYKRRRELWKHRRERERRRLQKDDREMAQLEELEAIIERQESMLGERRRSSGQKRMTKNK